jgi:hypothetical protein
LLIFQINFSRVNVLYFESSADDNNLSLFIYKEMSYTKCINHEKVFNNHEGFIPCESEKRKIRELQAKHDFFVS